MTSDLPAWAQTTDALPHLAGVIASPPETRISRTDWGSREVYRARPDVNALRRLYDAWLDAQIDALNAQYEVTGHYDMAARDEIARVEDADRLIRRLLTQNEELPGGRFPVAA